MVMHVSEDSVFNMAMAYLKRIDKLLYLCSYYSMNGNLDMWVHSIRAVYRELCVKLKENEEEEIIGKPETNIDPLNLGNVTKENATLNNINILFNHKFYKRKYKQQLLYFLDITEMKMRKKMQEKNMLLPSRSDPRFAVLER